jgi:ribosomal protein S26
LRLRKKGRKKEKRTKELYCLNYGKYQSKEKIINASYKYRLIETERYKYRITEILEY